MTIALRCLRALTLRRATHSPGRPFVSAASGLVCAHGRAYVVGDDEHHLALFDDAHAPGRSERLFDGALPAGPKARKRRKPDTETLLLLPSGRALLALGSGSRPQRWRAAQLALDARGQPQGAASLLDLAPLYAPLQQRLGELNIEGAFFTAQTFVLLQRGHRGGAPNLSIHYPRSAALAWLGARADAPTPQRFVEHRLAQVDGVPLTFTDGAALPGGGWVFAAVAEATDDAFADGACLASAVGLMDADHRLVRLQRLRAHPKVEGIAARARGGGLDLALVTDADDPAVPSRLLVGHLGAATP